MILLTIYLLGIVASLILMYRSLEKGDRVTVGDIILALIYSLSSWVGFIIVIGMFFFKLCSIYKEIKKYDR